MTATSYLDRGDGIRLAYARTPGGTPTVVFLSGYMSDMTGTKAMALEAYCAARGQGFLRLDYSGCGASGGGFEDGTIGRWRDDALVLIDRLTEGPLVLVGSSMGGWIALLLALARRDRIAGLIGIAAAPDFVDWGLLAGLSDDERNRLMQDGRLERPSGYGPAPYIYTRALVDDGKANRLLDKSIPYLGPVRLLHGQADPDVPWQLSLDIAARLGSSDVQTIFVKDGDHRLSRDADLKLLCATLDALLETVACPA